MDFNKTMKTKKTIGLIDCDKTNFPNLALMKLSAYHKREGDEAEWLDSFKHYDFVYISKVFDETYSKYQEPFIIADEIIRGGTGYGLDNKLPDDVEHTKPDTSIYGIKDTAYGFLTRGCPRACPFCIVAEKEGRKSVKVADLSEFWSGEKHIELLDPNILACPESENLLKQLADSKASVNFNQGLDARLLTAENIYLLNRIKISMLHFAWDLPEFSQKIVDGLKLYSELGAVKNYRNRKVYCLTNFGTSHKFDLQRVYFLESLGFDPYIMIYNKPSAPRITRQLQRYVNNKYIFRTALDFNDYLNYSEAKK